MLNLNIIQNKGCRNVTLANGKQGFQFEIRNPNYRGIHASLIEGIDIVFQGRHYAPEVATWTLQGNTYTFEELSHSVAVRWALDEVATITIPVEKPVEVGVHPIDISVIIRRPYIPRPYASSPFKASEKLVVLPQHSALTQPLSVSTYSYTNDIYTLMTLEDVMAEIADMGATGIEILSEANILEYPNPSSVWKDQWFRLLEKYALTPTNLASWIDTDMWAHRCLTEAEAAAQLQKDLHLAKELGFSSLRPKFGVTSLELDPHPVWREAVLQSLDLAAQLDVIICPEIHSPTPIQHPVTQDYIKLIESTQTEHFKLIIDTGIFQTAPVDLNVDGIELKEGEQRPAFLEPLAVPMSDLKDILKHVHFIQSKFFEVDDNLQDPHIPWQAILTTLQDGGWQGWLSTEYEGMRTPYRNANQVRRQHALLRTMMNKMVNN
ncbi:MAG: TIM barrel protein [Gammaproteobacteria bacterium]|nr:TIM barrel protein [Gammaproteobacteria bacterium]